MANGSDELTSLPIVQALRTGEKVRPLGKRFHVFLAVFTVLTTTGAAYGIVIALGSLRGFGGSSVLALLDFLAAAMCLIGLAGGWSFNFHAAVQLSAEVVTYWDEWNRAHRIRWEEVTDARWSRAGMNLYGWDLVIGYRRSDSTCQRQRKLRFWTTMGWRPALAEALRDQIIARSGLQLVEGDPDQEGEKVWRLPESQA